MYLVLLSSDFKSLSPRTNLQVLLPLDFKSLSSDHKSLFSNLNSCQRQLYLARGISCHPTNITFSVLHLPVEFLFVCVFVFLNSGQFVSQRVLVLCFCESFEFIRLFFGCQYQHDCLERPVPEVTYYMLSNMLNSTYSNLAYGVLCDGKKQRH